MSSWDESLPQKDFRRISTDSPQSPRIPVEEVQSAIDWLEKRHKKKLPVDIIYSDGISNGFCLQSTNLPLNVPLEKTDELLKERNSRLKAKGLSDSELKRINPAKYTIFLPRSKLSPYVDIYAALWEELGHVTAWVLGIDDAILNESLALSYRFRGLLTRVKEGQFLLDEVASKIEFEARAAGAGTVVMSKLRTMGLKANRHNDLTHYDDSLFAIKEYNPNLAFRNRSPDELVAELDKSIQHTLKCAKEKKFKFEKYFVLSLAGVILALVVAAILNHFFRI